jgi:transcriptional regulator with XRE-family HTH domain
MKFGEKVREQRKKRGLTQSELAAELGITFRTLRNYEKGVSYPSAREVYYKLAGFFDIDVNYFLTEDENYLLDISQQFGRRGREQAQYLLEQTAALFAGGELSFEDEIAFQREMQELFLDAATKAREKYSPKKHGKPRKDRE